MQVQIVTMGNSKGIRLPSTILKQCHFGDVVNLDIQDDKIIISAVTNKRMNWEDEFKMMRQNNDDQLAYHEELSNWTIWQEEDEEADWQC